MKARPYLLTLLLSEPSRLTRAARGRRGASWRQAALLVSPADGANKLAACGYDRTPRRPLSTYLLTSFILLPLLCVQPRAEADYQPGPKQLIQGYYKHLYESYKPDFVFSESDPVAASAAVAYIFLAGHRDEFRGRELSSPIIRRNIAKVREAQGANGSFGNSESHPVEQLGCTAASILALEATANPAYADSIRKARAWVTALPEDQLNSSAQLLRTLALHGEGKQDAARATRLARLSKQMEASKSPEESCLALLSAAIVRSSADLGSEVSQDDLKRVPDWQSIGDAARGMLAQFQKDKNVPGACIAVRVLHHYLAAQKRKPKGP